MNAPGPVRAPVANPLLTLPLGMFLAVLTFNLITTGFERAGVPRAAAGLVVVASLAGSLVNIPLRVRDLETRPAQRLRIGQLVFYRPPEYERQVIAVNAGGALIPVGVSAWLLVEQGAWWQTAVAVVIVAFSIHRAARVVPGRGILVPALLAPAVAALSALVLAWGGPGGQATAIAYAAGSVGTLIGADLLNLGRTGEMGPGIMSIGGAGVFDGVFLSGVVAAFLS
ncbi:MAG: hypothetical protein AMXMBFR80_05260 [Dehalococcoidia bacterium]|nr:DUF1614 domain-containing protein [Tepidiformaceae bacterium]